MEAGWESNRTGRKAKLDPQGPLFSYSAAHSQALKIAPSSWRPGVETHEPWGHFMHKLLTMIAKAS